MLTRLKHECQMLTNLKHKSQMLTDLKYKCQMLTNLKHKCQMLKVSLPGTSQTHGTVVPARTSAETM